MSTTPSHPLLRGGRWRLARPQSRALWTPATPRELAALFDDALLRARTEDFLRLVARTVDDVETLLIFDDDSVELAVAINLPPRPGARCVWDWIGRSLAYPRTTRADGIELAPTALPTAAA